MPGQAAPVNAAWTQISTVAFGPESVKSAKKLSASFGKTVTPFFTVFCVTAGYGSVTLFFGVRAGEHLAGELERREHEERRLAERDAVHVLTEVAPAEA